MIPGAPQNEPKRHPRGSKKRARIARRKKDRTKTIPRPSWTAHGPISLAQPPPPGSIWEPKTAPKPTPKRSKIEAKVQDDKRTIQDDLGPVLERSWVDLGPILGSSLAKKHYKKTQCFVSNHFFDDKTVRRQFRDQLGPKKAPT